VYRTFLLHSKISSPLIGFLVSIASLIDESAFAYQIQPNSVLVLYNADDGPDGPGQQIAEYYQQVRPGVHVVGIHGVNSYFNGDDTQPITAAQYLAPGDGSPGSGGIRRQVLDAIGAISDSIDVIVVTKGLPLRINAGYKPASSDSLNWLRHSSLESELARIDSIDTVLEMGDQFIATGFPQLDTSLASNPYYGTNGPFVRQGSDPLNGDIRLTARLDGQSVETVKAMIDRAQKAFVVPLPYGPMVVADDDPNGVVDQIDDYPAGPGVGLVNALQNWQTTAEQKIAASLGQPGYQFSVPFVQHNNTNVAITTAPANVIGYVSHGVNDGSGGLMAGYTSGQLQFQLANGAVFQSHESYNARSFDASFSQNQGLLAEWFDMGGTAGLGHVAEPYSGVDNVANEDLLYQMLLPSADGAPGDSGLTLVESAWNATRQLSYVNTVVGDPLMRFRIWLPGDFNLDGQVNLLDWAILQNHWQDAGATFAQGDTNGDGVVNLVDFAVVQLNWRKYAGYGQVVPTGPFAWAANYSSAAGSSAVAGTIPEPSAGSFLVFAVLISGPWFRRKSNR
jgi:uncharacterized protein (TIGR03790 family)